MQKRLFITTALAVMASLAAQPALAQDKAKIEQARALALYQGADRDAKLVAEAKREGEITIYHAYPALTKVIDAFGKKYGIKVNTWRSGSEAIVQRLTTEARAGRHEVDIVQNNAPENEFAHREKLLQEVRSPYQADLIPQAVPAHHEWAGITLDVWIAAYNTNKVKKEDLPKSYADLQDPKWKGKLGVEADDYGWFGALMSEIGEAQGTKVFNNIVATNGISVRKGHSLLGTLVASGDVPLALTIYDWNPPQLKDKGGAPIEGFYISPVIAQPSTIAMLKGAPHPAAALLFYDFMLSEGQQMLAKIHYTVTSKKLPSRLAGVQVKYIDPGKAIDNQGKWLKQYDEIILKKAR
jgi:iron(III) transport system substrate-binding protein